MNNISVRFILLYSWPVYTNQHIPFPPIEDCAETHTENRAARGGECRPIPDG